MFERGGPKGAGGLGVLPLEEQIRVFKFLCLKKPILTEMTVKYGKYFNFSANKGGVVLSGGLRTPPRTPPCGNSVPGYSSFCRPTYCVAFASRYRFTYFHHKKIIMFFWLFNHTILFCFHSLRGGNCSNISQLTVNQIHNTIK